MQIQLDKSLPEMALELANFFTKKTKVKFSPEDVSHLDEVKLRCLYGKLVLKMTYDAISNFLLNVPVSAVQIRYHIRGGIIKLFRHFINAGNPEKAMAFNNIRAKTRLIESLFGHRIQLRLGGISYPALISQNTKEGERPYRLTWFDRIKKFPINHIDFGKTDLNYILTKHEIPSNLLPGTFHPSSEPELIFESQ